MRKGMIAGIVALFVASCTSNSFEGKIVAVEVDELTNGSFIGAKLIAIEPGKPGKKAKDLSKDFESA